MLWGVATSAYQIGGGPESDWAQWEGEGKLRARHERCGAGAGHEERWKEDFDLLPGLGANAYRFSVEWSRIEPSPGRFSETRLSEERRRIEYLRRLGIEPVVTLLHYTHPAWFWRFGWESPEGRRAFVDFAGRCAEAFGDLVSLYTILNEPLVFILGGYLEGSIPPGRKNFSVAARALEGLLGAYAEAAAVLRDANPAARFGIAHNMMSFAAERPSSFFDRRLAASVDRFYNRGLLEAITSGRFDFHLPFAGRSRLNVGGLATATDFVGVNYYSRAHLRLPGWTRMAGEYRYRDPRARGLTDTGWEIHPTGLSEAIRQAAGTGRPVIVTENGIATRDDARRRDFLREHAVMIHHARRSGLDLEGYFHWSLLDNFEWLEGFSPRFGLYEVDYATFERRRRPSADLFAEIGRSFLRPAFTSP